MKKRLFCLVLALVMVIGMMPVISASAQTTDRVAELVGSMSLRDKVTQMMMVDFRKWGATVDTTTDFTVMNDEVRKIIEDYNFGSIILFANNIKETEQSYNLTMAMQELQRCFAPRIARQAGTYLSRLTGGVYDRIAISDDMTVRAARDDETTLRSPRWRSEGTGDQMYLALRLAVWQVLSQDAPMILDDALIRFDQERMEKAMDLLTELGKNRQILLFSCQEREKEYLLR